MRYIIIIIMILTLSSCRTKASMERHTEREEVTEQQSSTSSVEELLMQQMNLHIEKSKTNVSMKFYANDDHHRLIAETAIKGENYISDSTILDKNYISKTDSVGKTDEKVYSKLDAELKIKNRPIESLLFFIVLSLLVIYFLKKSRR